MQAGEMYLHFCELFCRLCKKGNSSIIKRQKEGAYAIYRWLLEST